MCLPVIRDYDSTWKPSLDLVQLARSDSTSQQPNTPNSTTKTFVIMTKRKRTPLRLLTYGTRYILEDYAFFCVFGEAHGYGWEKRSISILPSGNIPQGHQLSSVQRRRREKLLIQHSTNNNGGTAWHRSYTRAT